MASTVDLVIFDMDGVLAQLDRAGRLARLAELTGRTEADVQRLVFDSDFETGAEAGAHPTGAEYLAELNRRLRSGITRQEWVDVRREAMTIDPEVLALAEEVAGRCGIALLTNNGSLLQETLPEIVPDVARVFGRQAHTSSRFGARKPEAAVFQRLLAHHGVPPHRALFIDDDADYVAAAGRVGLHTIHHRRAEPLRARLGPFGLVDHPAPPGAGPE